jgi:hypothetical protein
MTVLVECLRLVSEVRRLRGDLLGMALFGLELVQALNVARGRRSCGHIPPGAPKLADFDS